jgi:hypothetical protein
MNRSAANPVVVLMLAIGTVCCLSGCDALGTSDVNTDSEGYERAIALLLPKRIEVQPFTRIASFNEDEVPDGISVYVRAVDQFGDPVKVAGTFLFELYSYRQASAERKGKRLEFWQTQILSEEDQLRYWDHTSQMYEFRLEVQQLQTDEGEPILARRKAVLLVTFNTPDGQHLTSQYIIEPKIPRGQDRIQDT